MQPIMSVIVPIYNVEKYVYACLESLALQTQLDIEYLLIDDGSTDQSGGIAKEFASTRTNFHYYQKPNGGLSDARNFGMKLAVGTYIAFMDSDDWLAPDYYATLLQVAQTTDADLVCSDITYAYEREEKIVKGADFSDMIECNDAEYPRYLLSTFPMAQNKLFKKSVLDKLQLQFPVGLLYEDVAFFYRLYPYLSKIAYVKNSGFYYRQRENSIMSSSSDRVIEIETVMMGIREWYKKRQLLPKYEQEIEYSFARHLLFASYGRLLKNHDYQFVKYATHSHWQLVNKYYPNWRKNKYWQDETLFRVPSQKVLYKGLTSLTYQPMIWALYQAKKLKK